MSKYKELYTGEVDILQTQHEIIICGCPDGELYLSHNCDTNGCTAVSHVLLRIPLSSDIIGFTDEQKRELNER